MPVAKKTRGPKAAVQDRPSRKPQREGGGAENQPPMGCAPDAPQGADPGPSPATAHLSAPNGSSAAGHQQPQLPSCGAACSGTLQVVLCNHSLWLTFHRQQNEMRLSRPGRAMFPFLAYQIRGMEPGARYRVFVDMVRVDPHHWRYVEAGWAPHRPEESNVPGTQVYPHPDSPNTGAHWMKREIAFKTLKLSNAEPAGPSNGPSARCALRLQSQHRYRPRLHVEELACGDPAAPAAPSRSHVFSFPETEFIAVTAYRNPELVRLKIDHNPYASAFRRDAPSAGGFSAGQPPGPAASQAAPDPTGQPPWPQEHRDRDREIWTHGTLTDSEAAAWGERAPKKRRLSPGPSGCPALSSARTQPAAPPQRLPATEASAKASPAPAAAASEHPGDLLGTEEAAVQEGNRAIPAACWPMPQPQQLQYYVSDSTRSSSNGPPTWQVMTLNPGLQTSTAPLDVAYGWGPESLLALLQEPTLPGEPSQAIGGDCSPSLPLHPVPGAQEEPSVQEQIWPHLAQTQLEDSAQTEGAPEKRRLSPPASDSQATGSGRDGGEAQDQLLTAAACSPYTFSEAASEDPGHLLGFQEAPAQDNRNGIPVLWNAPQQSQPPLHCLFYSTPSSSNSNSNSNSRSLPSLEDEAIEPSISPLAMPHEASPDLALFSLLKASGCISENSQGTHSDCLPSGPFKPMHPVPGAQEAQSLQQKISPSLTETVSEDSPQAPRTSEKTPLSPKNDRGQDPSFLIPDFSWDSLFLG